MGLGWDVSGLTGRTIQVLDTPHEETWPQAHLGSDE